MPCRASQALATLTDGTSLRLWSYLITIFGDLAQAEGQWVSSRALAHLCEGVGAKRGSQRVAIHRLCKDGWLLRRKEGRRSFYALSPAGRQQAAEASGRIYAATNQAPEAWLIVHPAGATESTYPLTAHMSLGASPPQGADTLALPLHPSQSLPAWLMDKVCPQDLTRQATALLARLQRIRSLLADASSDLTLSERALIRTLIVHEWRRLILKRPALPDFLFPDQGAWSACRDQALALLDLLGPCDLAALEADLAALGAEG